MCAGCWEELGSPRIDTPAVRAAKAAIEEVYEFSMVGGNLHIVLDDFNIRDEDLAWCEARIAEGGFVSDVLADGPRDPDSAEQLAAEQRCLDLLKPLSEEERASALALFDGFWQC